jgi:hypothetical protein
MLFAHRASFVNSPALDNRNQEPEHKIARNKRKFMISHSLLLVCVIRFATHYTAPLDSRVLVCRGRKLAIDRHGRRTASRRARARKRQSSED